MSPCMNIDVKTVSIAGPARENASIERCAGRGQLTEDVARDGAVLVRGCGRPTAQQTVGRHEEGDDVRRDEEHGHDREASVGLTSLIGISIDMARQYPRTVTCPQIVVRTRSRRYARTVGGSEDRARPRQAR